MYVPGARCGNVMCSPVRRRGEQEFRVDAHSKVYHEKMTIARWRASAHLDDNDDGGDGADEANSTGGNSALSAGRRSAAAVGAAVQTAFWFTALKLVRHRACSSSAAACTHSRASDRRHGCRS